MDHLAYMMLSGPAFVDQDFIGRDLPTAFHELNEALRLIQGKLGDERYAQLVALSSRVQAHYEADPTDKTEEAVRGRELILKMEDILRGAENQRHTRL